jgi:hypothetical protein
MPKIKIDYERRNLDTACSFFVFCLTHPQLRFWQALVSWAGYSKIIAVPPSLDTKYGRTPQETHFDTFNWEGRDHDDV